MYFLTFTEDLYGYFSEQYQTNGMKFTADSFEEAFEIAEQRGR